MAVTHICISDLHCGAISGLLTPLERKDDGKPTPLGAAFGQALRQTLAKLAPPAPPELVVLGDALDLSIGTPARASAGLAGFLNAIYKGSGQAPGRLIFVPGNHDHQLWTAERFSRRAERTKELTPWSHVSPAFAPTDKMGGDQLLEDVLALADIQVDTRCYYPNFGLTDATGQRAILLHHGHFFETMYTAMTRLVAAVSGSDPYPDSLQAMEQVNSAWIDFIFSNVGDTGPLGREAALAYQYLLTGGAAAGFQQRLARLMTDTMLEKLPLPTVGGMADALHMVSSGLVDATVGKFAQLERFSYTHTLGQDSVEGLRAYMSGPTLKQMQAELGPDLPRETSLIFGHTHKPFEDRIPIPGFSGSVGVVNTGGWILDTSLLSTVEGASAVLIDDAMNIAVIKLFAPPVNGITVPVKVTGIDGEDEPNNPLLNDVKAAVAAAETLWSDMAEVAAETYRERQALVIRLLAEADAKAKRTETVL